MIRFYALFIYSQHVLLARVMNRFSFEDASRKQKLTLTVSRDVIAKAREAGVNISDITEKLLTVISFKTRDGYTFSAVSNAYEAIFECMSHVLADYGADSIEVGIHPRVVDDQGKQHYKIPIFFSNILGFHVWIEGFVSPMTLEFRKIFPYLLPIMRILENMFQCLAAAAEDNKEQISELQFALRLVESLSRDKEKQND